MNLDTLNRMLFAFITESPTPYHAITTISKILENAGFTALSEKDNWQLQIGKPYFIVRENGALVAFNLGKGNQSSFRIIGSHSDSPCLQIKPKPDLYDKSFHRLGVEVYGGALLHPWFDRELSIAGRIVYRSKDSQLHQKLINFDRPVAIIPSLAIHLDRDANKEKAINPQTDISPIVGLVPQEAQVNFLDHLKHQLRKEHGNIKNIEILSYDLYLNDYQKPGYTGLDNEFIASSRLDNLLSCCIAAYAIASANTNNSFMFVCNNHEEIGSTTSSGAQGNLVLSIFERLLPNIEHRHVVFANSFLISLDNAHAVHPNYPSKFEQSHDIFLNNGPVLKINANHRYATSGPSNAIFKQLCNEVKIPFQEFVMRNDMACGSTIGPMTSSKLGIRTVDVGSASLAMHSIRELTGSNDPYLMYKVIHHFFTRKELPAVNN